MTRLYYQKTPLLWDLLRGSLGLTVTVLPLILLDNILPVIVVILVAIAGLFLVFIARIALRHKTEIQLTQDGIMIATPLGRKEIAWLDMTAVALSYFSTSRSGAGKGIMTLKLTAGDTIIRIDSSLDGFDTVVKQIARVCAKLPVAVSPTTVHNFDAMGAPIVGDQTPEAR